MKKCIKKKLLIQKIKFAFIFIIVILVFQSTYAQRVEIPLTPRYTEQELKDLRKRTMNGDTVAFNNYVFYAKYSPESLPYALFIANNYHYPRAYFYVYKLTLMLFEENGLLIDSTSYSFAFKYLLKGAELGSLMCNNQLAHIYYFGNKYIQQDTIRAKEFYIKKYGDADEKQRRWNSFKQVYQRAFDAREERY